MLVMSLRGTPIGIAYLGSDSGLFTYSVIRKQIYLCTFYISLFPASGPFADADIENRDLVLFRFVYNESRLRHYWRFSVD